ncbi:MAG: sugar phosphate isomerase/epimerase [Paucibacter sp.]|nr:sugar phosphate isomerase/epimerase [Roseateles sp.]
MKRRSLLLALLASGANPLAHSTARAADSPRIAHPGVQLYTVRTGMEKDFRGTLAAVARLGYQEVEFAGYFGQKPADIKALLRDLNLTAPSAHVGDSVLGPEAARVIDEALTIGHHYLVVPWTPQEQWRDLDAWKRRAEAFNRAGETCRNAGLQLCYHNHHFEFATVNGQQPYELLLTRCDPALVQMELDLYWAAVAGQDPLALMRRYPGRFPMVHLKQAKAAALAAGQDVLSLNMDQAHHLMTEVGPGLIDFPRLLADPASAGIRHFFVEHDAAASPMESLGISLRFMKGLTVKMSG